jgi:hypothetical protein
MKLLIVTAVSDFRRDAMKLFKKANVQAFSSSDIEGHENLTSVMVTQSWFPMQSGAKASLLLFSFTEEDKIDILFELIKKFNDNPEITNPIRAVVVPIEQFI